MIDRMTEQNGDYCRDICGQFKTCKRLEANDLCEDAKRYCKLQAFENAQQCAETIMKEAGY